MAPDPKAIESAGEPATVNVAEELSPIPPSFEVTADVKLFLMPRVVASTFTEIAHWLFTTTDPLLRLKVAWFAKAATVPPHEFVKPFGFAICRPAGS